MSMTGYGEAHRQQAALTVSAEVRTINSRYLKLSLRTSDGYGSLEPMVESVVRKRIHRGTIQVTLRVDRAHKPEDYRIDQAVLNAYRRQLMAIQAEWNCDVPVSVEGLLALPGVVDQDAAATQSVAEDWPVIAETLEAAIDSMDAMRVEEGRAMTVDLKANCCAALGFLADIERRAPLVVEAHRAKLEQRLKKVLAEFEISLEPADLIKEVSLFGERSDISEEIVRLRSHLEQFDATLALPESTGRKLEFRTQEMFREVNTIGSKANDLEISRQAIEIKSVVERIREMIQNIE
jgi:uncharacterized protein (TIGR00255 family)